MFDIDTNVDNLSQEVNYTIKSIPSVNALSRIIKKGLRLEKKGYTVNYKYGNNREIGQQLKLAAEKVSNQFDYTTPKKVAWGVGGVLGFTTILNKINDNVYELGVFIGDSETKEAYTPIFGDGLIKDIAAGAVFFSVIFGLIVAVMIYYPKFS